MSNILRKEEANMVHSFYYPRNRGSQFIVDRLAEGLQLNTGVQVETLERFSDSWVVNGQWMAQQVVLQVICVSSTLCFRGWMLVCFRAWKH